MKPSPVVASVRFVGGGRERVKNFGLLQPASGR